MKRALISLLAILLFTSLYAQPQYVPDAELNDPVKMYGICKEKDDVPFDQLRSCSLTYPFPVIENNGLQDYTVKLWSGNIKNGMPDGYGYGIAGYADKVFYIRGAFDNGRLASLDYTKMALNGKTRSGFTRTVAYKLPFTCKEMPDGYFQTKKGASRFIINRETGYFHDLKFSSVLEGILPCDWEVVRIEDIGDNVKIRATHNKNQIEAIYLTNKKGDYIGPDPEFEKNVVKVSEEIRADLLSLGLVWNPKEIEDPIVNLKKHGVYFDEIRERNNARRSAYPIKQHIEADPNLAKQSHYLTEIISIYLSFVDPEAEREALIRWASKEGIKHVGSIDVMVTSMIGRLSDEQQLMCEIWPARIDEIVADQEFQEFDSESGELLKRSLKRLYDEYAIAYKKAYDIAEQRVNEALSKFVWGTSESSTPSTPSSSSSTTSFKKMSRCKVRLVFRDGTTCRDEQIMFSSDHGFFRPGHDYKAQVDSDGYAILEWPEEECDEIVEIYISSSFLEHRSYNLVGLSLKDGCYYNICIEDFAK